ncbi:MAG TPA: chemotaxis-specific protein-glutamate methyltransferase CheB [Chloroflexi bacterium]|nr:chemotaxis-specific protein-glutamate methyltransferase CheB [Chloroflexota bacterium]
MKDIIRVLVVDDSQVVRQILISMIETEPGFQVVGQARDGEEAIRLTARLRPDVITMDIRMPRLDGLEAIRRIMSTTPTPIVVVASSAYETDRNIAFAAIEAGALTVVEKPAGITPKAYAAARHQLITTIRLMSDVQVVTLKYPVPRLEGMTLPQEQRVLPTQWQIDKTQLIAIAASTGGPGVLREILSALPADLSIPILAVQHITPGFSQGFAQWLDSETPLQVSLAQDGERVRPGHVLIAPDDTHLTVTPAGIARLDKSPPVKGQRPSATRLFESVARAYGAASVGVVLTGMGEDGADGLEVLHHSGGHIIAQDEQSCVVFGMPKVAIERGVVNRVMPPDKIASVIKYLDTQRKAHRKERNDQGGQQCRVEMQRSSENE